MALSGLERYGFVIPRMSKGVEMWMGGEKVREMGEQKEKGGTRGDKMRNE